MFNEKGNGSTWFAKDLAYGVYLTRWEVSKVRLFLVRMAATSDFHSDVTLGENINQSEKIRKN
jgi:hypothetical protein